MDKFDRLNRETKDHNNRSCTPPSQSTSTITGAPRIYNNCWESHYNNQTYKANNGEYSRKYY